MFFGETMFPQVHKKASQGAQFSSREIPKKRNHIPAELVKGLQFVNSSPIGRSQIGLQLNSFTRQKKGQIESSFAKA